ncbi:MAG: hypothetical protein DRQ47_10520 [Gammaproteobacteria bacterium]|nr:MAG: hypothetical protein DRQ47_10520 [Gammaproteobacteria bacterium]
MDAISVKLEISEEAIVATDLGSKEVVTFVKDTQLEEEFEIIKFLLQQLHGKGVYGQGEKIAGKCIMGRANTKFGEAAVSRLLIAYMNDD